MEDPIRRSDLKYVTSSPDPAIKEFMKRVYKIAEDFGGDKL